MLLVDHDHAEVVEVDRLGEQRVRPDEEVDGAVAEPGGDACALLGRRAVGQELHAQRPVGEERALFGRHGEVAQQIAYRDIVLLREHLGGRHERALPAALHAHQQRGDGHDGLARPHVALEQAVHGMRAGQVGRQLIDRVALGARERERKRVVEAVHELAVDRVTDALCLALQRALAHHQRELQPQQLVEHEALARRLSRAHRLRRVHLVERPRAVDDIETVAPFARQRVGQLARPSQRLLHPATQLPGREAGLVRLGVDGHDAPGAVADEVDDRVGHLPPSPVGLELAEEHGVGALLQLLGAPRLVEERAAQIAGAIEHVDLDEGAALPGASRLNPLHHREHHGLVADLEVLDGGLLRTVEVTARVVGDQVEDGRDLHRLQRLDLLGPDAVEHRDRQLGQLAQPPRHPPTRR